MATEWIAATTGLAEFSQRQDDRQQVGLGQRLGRAELLDVGAAGERLAGAGDDDGLDRGIGVGLVQAVGDAAAGGIAQPVDRRVVHRDHGDVAVHLVFSGHAGFLVERREKNGRSRF